MQYQVKQEGDFQFIDEGKGPTMLLLHGLFGALSNWVDVVGKFSPRYNVVIPMLPIYSLPLLNTNVKAMANFVDSFIKFKKYSDIILIGNSLGGHISLVYIKDHQDVVKKLVLTGSSGLYENSMGGTFPRREDYNYIKEKVGYTFYDPNTASKELVDECFAIVNDKGRLIRILAIAKSAIRHNMGDELKDIHVSTCLIWGKQDVVTPPEVAEEFHKLLPNSELFWIDKCGHAPMMERPNEFNDILDKWLLNSK